MMSEINSVYASHNSSKDSACLTNSQHEDDQDDLVFQCSQCNSIIGDSRAWKSANEILRAISLRCVSNKVCVTEKLLTSKSGDDIGSTYSLIQCEVCKDEIGRMYRTTPCHLDSMRGAYTFYVDKLTSYQLGSYDQTCERMDLSDIVTLPDMKRLHQQLQKLQAIIVCMDQRVKGIEKVMTEESDDIPPHTPGTNRTENYTPEPADHGNNIPDVDHHDANKTIDFTSTTRDKTYEQHQLSNGNSKVGYSFTRGKNISPNSADVQKSARSPDIDSLKRKMNSLSQGKVTSSTDKKRKRIA